MWCHYYDRGLGGGPLRPYMDHSLGQDVERLDGLLAVVSFSLRSLPERKGMRGPLSPHLGVLFDFEETI
jgi:hypothetical protein